MAMVTCKECKGQLSSEAKGCEMRGWRDEADTEDIEDYAGRLVNNDGEREYGDAYAAARRMKEAGCTLEEIESALIREPEVPQPADDGHVAMIHRKHYAGQ